MKHFLTFLSVILLPLACVGAPSYTTYFNNTHTYTNATVAGTSTANRLVATNGVYSLGSGTGGTFVGHPADSEIYWGSSDFTGLSFIDVVGSDTSPFTQLIMGNFISSAPTTRSLLEVSTDTNSVALALTRRISGALSGRAELEVDSTGQRLVFGSATQDTFLLRDAANMLAMRNGTAPQQFNIYNTFTDDSNLERANLFWSGNVFYLSLGSVGTGLARSMRIGTTGAGSVTFITTNADRWNFSSAGHFLANTDNTYDIGASGATRPRDVFVADDVVAGGDVTAGALLQNSGIRVMTPSSLQTLAAGNALLANATKVRVVGSGGAVTLTSTPTIADGSDGQYVMIQGTNDTNTLTVQDQGSLASSNLELGAATRVLGAGDVLVLTFDTTASVWYEVSFANN